MLLKNVAEECGHCGVVPGGLESPACWLSAAKLKFCDLAYVRNTSKR